MRKKTGVLLLNLGGPDSLGSVKPFLYNLFSDREIIRLGPRPLQRPLAFLISALRAPKSRRAYAMIGGKSPLAEITAAQAGALEKALGMPVYFAMRYWRPSIEDTVKSLYEDGIERVIALSLYPHYSVATTGSSLRKFREAVRPYPIETVEIGSWHDHPLYIDALLDVIKRGVASFEGGGSPHLLFSAHSLPKKFIEAGDPYVGEIMGTIGKVIERQAMRWHLGYQSRSGPVRWLGPPTEEVLRRLARKGVRNVLVVPISFVSDHIETLYEIDILYKGIAEALGIELRRTESLNTNPLFIDALKALVIEKDKGAGR